MSSGTNAYPFRRQVVKLVVVLALFFAGVPNSGLAFTQDRLSAEDKELIFEKVWSLINDRYYDPAMNGVDWAAVKGRYRPLIATAPTDSEFYDVVKRMVAEMKDAHTRFLTPRESREHRARQGTTAGILLSRIEGKTVVEKVLPSDDGDLAKVKTGMIVRTVDGKPAETLFLAAKKAVGASSSDRALEIMAYRRMLRGDPGTAVRIGLTDSNGRDFEVTLVRRTVSEKSEAIGKVLPSGFGYIAITSFKAPISGKFKRTLEGLKDTPALIIDLRYNGGGSINEVLTMAGAFLDRRYSFGKFMRRSRGSKQTLRKFSAGAKGKQLYSKPLIILTSKYSASGSELFASSLQELGRARIIGTQTCGCLLGISRKHRLRDGSELHISDIGFISAKGRIYEKVGVTPDKVLDLNIADLRSGLDRGVVEAENMLTEAALEN